MDILASAKVMTFIVTADRKKAIAFYGGLLGFKKIHEDDFAVVFDLNGTMLRISAVADHQSQQHTILGWEVTDIAAAVTALRDKGVVFKIYEGFGQDELGIWSAPGSSSKVAWFADSDGNVLSMTQF